jgi:hypothetical protein
MAAIDTRAFSNGDASVLNSSHSSRNTLMRNRMIFSSERQDSPDAVVFCAARTFFTTKISGNVLPD